jgi:hypothetical protein
MKPQAIAWFDRLFMGSMAFSAVDVVINWPTLLAELEVEPALAKGGFSIAIAIAIGLVVIAFGLYLLLWYLISLKRSRVTKWIMVVVALLTAASTVGELLLYSVDEIWLILVTNALLVAATATLFLPGAADWFRPNLISPATFE